MTTTNKFTPKNLTVGDTLNLDGKDNACPYDAKTAKRALDSDGERMLYLTGAHVIADIETDTTYGRMGRSEKRYHITLEGGLQLRVSPLARFEATLLNPMVVDPTKPTKPTEIDVKATDLKGLTWSDFGSDRQFGVCYCCGRAGFMVSKAKRTKGNLSRHGFTRPSWMSHGIARPECDGSHMTPSDTLDVAIAGAVGTERILQNYLIEPNLTAHTIFRISHQIKMQQLTARATWKSGYKMDSRNRYRSTRNRDEAAKALRDVRNGVVPHYTVSLTVPKVKAMLTRELEQCQRWLADLRVVEARRDAAKVAK